MCCLFFWNLTFYLAGEASQLPLEEDKEFIHTRKACQKILPELNAKLSLFASFHRCASITWEGASEKNVEAGSFYLKASVEVWVYCHSILEKISPEIRELSAPLTIALEFLQGKYPTMGMEERLEALLEGSKNEGKSLKENWIWFTRITPQSNT